MPVVNPFKPLINKIPPPFRNRQYLVMGIFLLWMVFFDKHDVLTQWRLNRTISKLEEDRRFYEQQIQEVKQDKVDMESNKEKFAREHYFMRESNEDVFVIEEEK